jgi:hypothetical protein
MEGSEKMTMEKGEFVYWLDGFTAGKTRMNADETALVKTMLDIVFHRKPEPAPLPSPPFNPDFAPVGSGL